MRNIKHNRIHMTTTPSEEMVYNMRMFGMSNKDVAFYLGKSAACVANQFAVAKDKKRVSGLAEEDRKKYGYGSLKRAKGRVMVAHG